jgi:hypothetical protein
MAHLLHAYADRVNELLHHALGGTLCFKQEIIEVPGLLVGLLVTYDGVLDDSRQISDNLSWEQFLERMSLVKWDWKHFDRAIIEKMVTERSGMCIGGWEGKTIYFIRAGRDPERWTAAAADEAVPPLVTAGWRFWGSLVQYEIEHVRELVPVGQKNFRDWEHMVRVIFNFLFRDELGQGRPSARTEPENEGLEIRDILYPNTAESGLYLFSASSSC